MKLIATILTLFLAAVAAADEALYRYEGNVHPLDPGAGWIIGNACEPPCSESLEDGHFVFFWSKASDFASYAKVIANPPNEPPPSLWVEWRFRSNFPLGPIFVGCDAAFKVHYLEISDGVDLYGDSVITFDSGDFVLGLSMEDFHTYRFESVNGRDYSWSVDGERFAFRSSPKAANGYNSLQMRGRGGCFSDWHPNLKNEWDFVRYGTIGFGERIVATDPPSGTVSSDTLADLTSFTVTFDTPNYVYLDEIRVYAGGVAPEVVATRRREEDEPDTVEFVLDRAPPTSAITRFLIDNGRTKNVIEYADVDLGQGACCLPDSVCQNLSELGCGLVTGATFHGAGSSCDDPGLECPCAIAPGADAIWRIAECLHGPGVTPPPHCVCSDGDNDADVDLGDFAELQCNFDPPFAEAER